jgi:hypothetical protein
MDSPAVGEAPGAPADPAALAAFAAARRRSVRRSAIVLTLIAAGFYFGFIAMMLVRGSQ